MTDAPKPKRANTIGPESGDEREGTSAELPRWVTPAIVALVAIATAFYFWLVFTRWGAAEKWGNFGDAVGPFVGLLNAGALFAALYSVRLQRRELELQRQELRETRDEMVEQRKQFERTAKAQEASAKAQKELAYAQTQAVHAQREANDLSHRAAIDAEIAQRCANIAVLQAAVANVQIAFQTSGLHAKAGERLGQELVTHARSLHREMTRLKELGTDLGAAP
jgi:hypothetical protein